MAATDKRARETSTISDDHHPVRRQKRDKYTAVACDECKKRKVKCDGEKPCQRCAQVGFQCAYNPGSVDPSSSTQSRLNSLDARYKSLQEQVDDLKSQLRMSLEQPKRLPSITDTLDSIDQQAANVPLYGSPLPSRAGNRQHKAAHFAGPSSIQYGIEVGKTSLLSIGVRPDDSGTLTNANSPLPTRPTSPLGTKPVQQHQDPLRIITYGEGLRLMKYYEEELYPIYPLLNSSQTQHVAKAILKQADGTASVTTSPEKSIEERDVDILRMVLATSLIMEGQGQSQFAEEMAATVQENVGRRSWTMMMDLKDVLLLTMMSVYFFQCDEEVMAWRVIGSAVRSSQEIGLHRHNTLLRMFPDEETRRWAIKLFWSIYVLDQRWSLGSGLPCALNPVDIDPQLPEPHDATPYTKCLLSYARLSSKVMKYVDSSANLSPRERREEAGYLDFQLQQWQKAISPELQLIHPNSGDQANNQPRNLQRLRVLLYARCNHLRIVNRRHYLLSASNISENLPDARFVVDTAKDTIQVLAHLNSTSDIYQKQQSLFNYFLISALAALFLAVCHGPTYFSDSSRKEFLLALDLVKGFSSKSLVSRRLWKTVRELRLLAPKLGLTTPATAIPTVWNTQDAMTTHQMGDLVMDTLIPNPDWALDGMWAQPDELDWMGLAGTPDMASQMNCALTDLFDAMGAMPARQENAVPAVGQADVNGFGSPAARCSVV